MEKINLEDKVIIIAGGAGLLGRVFIEAVLDEGAIAIIADIDEGAGKQLVDELKLQDKDNRVDFVKLDIAFDGSILEMIDYVSSKYNKIDAFVNCTLPKSENWYRKFEDTKYEDFCKHTDLHLGGYFLTTQQLMTFFKKQGYGDIINIASIYGLMPPRFEIYDGTEMTTPVAYATAKAGIIHLTKYLAKYFKGSNVRFNCISPGGILNNQPVEFQKNYNKYQIL